MQDVELKAFSEAISARLVGRKFESLLFFNFDSAYIDFDPEPVWIVNAGAELHLDDCVFTYGWNRAQELFDFQLGDRTDWFEELDAEELNAMEIDELKALQSKPIIAVDIRWNWYHPLDEDLQPTEDRTFIPEEVTIELAGGNRIQLAGVAYHIREGKLKSLQFNPMANLLIAVDRPMEIQVAPQEEANEFEEEY